MPPPQPPSSRSAARATDSPAAVTLAEQASARSPRWRVPRLLARFLTRGDRGRLGETLALRHLRRSGYRIRARNVRMRAGEIDLIVTRGEVLAFVEVRTRQPNSALPPEVSVDATKQAHIVQAADEWLMRNRKRERWLIRFDVIAIELDDAKRIHRLAHFERAFEPSRTTPKRR